MFNLSYFLQNHHEPISDLFIDLRDGNRLLSLLEVLTSKTYVSMLSQTYFVDNNRLSVILHKFFRVILESAVKSQSRSLEYLLCQLQAFSNKIIPYASHVNTCTHSRQRIASRCTCIENICIRVYDYECAVGVRMFHSRDVYSTPAFALLHAGVLFHR